MIKIMITVKNRLSITKKCVESIERNAVEPYQLYIYENSTNYRLDEHFDYWRKLYKLDQNEWRIQKLRKSGARIGHSCLIFSMEFST